MGERLVVFKPILYLVGSSNECKSSLVSAKKVPSVKSCISPATALFVAILFAHTEREEEGEREWERVTLLSHSLEYTPHRLVLLLLLPFLSILLFKCVENAQSRKRTCRQQKNLKILFEKKRKVFFFSKTIVWISSKYFAQTYYRRVKHSAAKKVFNNEF